jgi:hypothetical protein
VTASVAASGLDSAMVGVLEGIDFVSGWCSPHMRA